MSAGRLALRRSSGGSAQAVFTVQASWPQFRNGSLHRGDNHRERTQPLDPSLAGPCDPRLRAFTGHGRIETLPGRQSRRRLLLDKIAPASDELRQIGCPRPGSWPPA